MTMARAGTKTTTSGLDWNIMLGLSHRLKQDGNLKFYLLILTGCYFGLRAGDLLQIRWCQLIDKDDLTLKEQKTGKLRKITINTAVKEALTHVRGELTKVGRYNEDSYVFAHRWGEPVSISYVNKQLHKIFPKYNVKVQNPSTHTLRKSFGRRVFEQGNKSEKSLIYLSDIFSHNSIATTRKYIGVTERQIADVYLQL